MRDYYSDCNDNMTLLYILVLLYTQTIVTLSRKQRSRSKASSINAGQPINPDSNHELPEYHIDQPDRPEPPAYLIEDPSQPLDPEYLVHQINNKESTQRPQNVEPTSPTTAYYTMTRRTLPPWHWKYGQIIEIKENNNEEVTRVHNLDTRTYSTDPGSSTRTSPTSDCLCEYINDEKILAFLLKVQEEGSYHQRKLDYLQHMGISNAEQARRCLYFCNPRSPSMTFTSSSASPPPNNRNSNTIKFSTEILDPKYIENDKSHCYHTMLSRSMSPSDTRICSPNYRATDDSPQPSTKPKGLNVWKCCKRIVRSYYYN